MRKKTNLRRKTLKIKCNYQVGSQDQECSVQWIHLNVTHRISQEHWILLRLLKRDCQQGKKEEKTKNWNIQTQRTNNLQVSKFSVFQLEISSNKSKLVEWQFSPTIKRSRKSEKNQHHMTRKEEQEVFWNHLRTRTKTREKKWWILSNKML